MLSGVRQEKLYQSVGTVTKEGYPIAWLCEVLALNRSSYYKWTHRRESARELENGHLLHEIGFIYAEHNGTYGYRRLLDEYNIIHDTHYNHKRFQRLTAIVGLKAIIRRKRPNYQRSNPEVTAENILNRNFIADKSNEKWLTDVTEMKYGNGEKLYLSAILDLKGRDIVSFAIDPATTTSSRMTPLTWRYRSIRLLILYFTATGDFNIQAKHLKECSIGPV